MSVKRHDFDCYAFYDSARLNVQECDDGDYVLYSDYAALEACHNALREAVEWERECMQLDFWFVAHALCYYYPVNYIDTVRVDFYRTREAASAAVDRLFSEGF